MFQLTRDVPLACLVLLASSCSAEEDGQGSTLETLFEIDDRISADLCECGIASCDEIDRSCEREVVLGHASDIEHWAECTLDASRMLETCIREADCDFDAVNECYVDGPNQICGDIPPRASMALVADFMRECGDEPTGDAGGDGDGDDPDSGIAAGDGDSGVP